MACLKKWTLFCMLVCSAGNVSATEEIAWSEGFKLAGEIVVTPSGDAVKSTAAGASESRKKARAARDPSVQTPQTIIIVPEDEEGVLSPSGIAAPPDNRAKARDYSRGVDPTSPAAIVILPDGTSSETARENSLARNRSKARQYSDEGAGRKAQKETFVKIGTAVGVMGADGVVVYVCDDTNNAAGRIGDDTQPGNVFTVMVGGKPVKARCK